MPDLANPSGTTTITAELCAALGRGDDRAWHDFLGDWHGLFVRAVRTAAFRLGQRVVRDSEPALVDDAKTYFYSAFGRGFRAFEGEGRFCAFVFATTVNFLREQIRANRRGFVSLDADPEDGGDGEDGSAAVAEAALGQWRESARGPDPGLLARLHQCLARLPQEYRAIVTTHFFQDEARPLRALAVVFGLSVEALHKRFQRGLARLRECLGGELEASHAV